LVYLPTQAIYDSYFINKDFGYFKEQYSGASYITIFKYPDDYKIIYTTTDYVFNNRNIIFVNDSTGFLSCRVLADTTYAILKTVDSAYNWNPVMIGNEFINDLNFIDDQFGYACCTHGLFYRTSDGGTNWETVVVDTLLNFTAVDFVNEQIGFMGSDNGRIFKTYDCGNSWNELAVYLPEPKEVNILKCTSPMIVYFDVRLDPWYFCLNYDLYKTYTAGINVEINSCADINSGYIEINILSGAPDTLLLYSIDGGISFQEENLFENLPLGLYNIVVTYDEMEILTMEYNLEIIVPPVNLGSDTTIKIDQSIILDAGQGFSSFLWNTGDTVQIIEVAGDFYGEGEHLFYVTAQDTNGCVSSDSILVSIIDDSGINNLAAVTAFKIFPNPVDNKLNIYKQTSDKDPYQIKIFDCFNRLILETEVIENKKTIFFENNYRLKPGLYYSIINHNNQIYNFKFIKM